MQPLVTIGIPTYNRGDERLQRVIDAALRQTAKNIEVLVSDNASTDGTELLMKSISDPRVRYVRQTENIGANANFNFLLNEAKGQWFLLFHDDDLVDADFIESCIELVGARNDVGFVVSGVRTIDTDGNVIKETPNQLVGRNREDFYLGWFKSEFALFLCNTLYNTQKLRSVGGFHSLHYLLEDNYALVKLLNDWSFCICSDTKASYRYTYDQRTYQVPVVEWCQDFQQLLQMIVSQVSSDSRVDIRSRGHFFFGQLCNMRANAIASRARQAWARLVVARYFGVRALLQSWRHRS